MAFEGLTTAGTVESFLRAGYALDIWGRLAKQRGYVANKGSVRVTSINRKFDYICDGFVYVTNYGGRKYFLLVKNPGSKNTCSRLYISLHYIGEHGIPFGTDCVRIRG